MFKSIFKKDSFLNQEAILEELPKNLSKKIYPKEVMEIHHEFETASDKLVEQALEIINSQPKVNESKINRLQKFGFTQVKEIEEGVKVIKTTSFSKDQIDLVTYFKQNYPFHKFITEEQVKEICHKYNLVCGEVSRFRGFVPDENLKALENFKLKSEDNMSPILGEKYIIMDDWSLLKINDIEKAGFIINSDIKYFIEKYLPENNYAYFGTKSSNSKTNIPGWAKGFQYRENNLSDQDIRTAIEINSKKLMICAPIKDMDIRGLELKEGYKLEKKHIPDPVVLQPVRGGYLILTAWGDEASDPLVVNQINN